MNFFCCYIKPIHAFRVLLYRKTKFADLEKKIALKGDWNIPLRHPCPYYRFTAVIKA